MPPAHRAAATIHCRGTYSRIFPVFDGQVTTMEGEVFTISLMEGAEPFCVKVPRSISFAYHEQLKKELDLLQQQGIITPVTEVTE